MGVRLLKIWRKHLEYETWADEFGQGDNQYLWPYFNQLDVAAGKGRVDGLIGKADVKAYQSQQVRDFFRKNPGMIKTIAQTMQRKNGRRMGKIQKLLGLLDGEFAKLGQAIRAGNKPKIESCAKKCFGDVAKRSNFDNLDPNMMAEMALREA